MSVVGGGSANKAYADYIKLKGEECKYYSDDMKNIALKNHAIGLFEEEQRAYE